jgi:hypothetical protein
MKKSLYYMIGAILVAIILLITACTPTTECIKEGEMYNEYESPSAKCCDGLTPKLDTAVASDGETCGPAECPCYVCVKCGDGECGLGENKCMCPEDCSSE